jgi:hypothetical protein
MWAAKYVVKPGEKKKYPKLAQIRYAGKTPGLETTVGPFKLLKNVKYKVHIEIYGREFASEIFFINDDNKAALILFRLIMKGIKFLFPSQGWKNKRGACCIQIIFEEWLR